MNVAETIQRKVFQLPLKAQEEALEAIEHIEEKYNLSDEPADSDAYPLGLIANLATDMGVTDFSEHHDYYANGKRED